MSYLIDTHVLLWTMGDSSRLSRRAKEAIINVDNEIYVSIASVWEIAIKLSIGKLDLDKTLDEIIKEIDFMGFFLLPISLDALRVIREMPFHHRDPFDRLIIAEALIKDMKVMTSDQKFLQYKVGVLW